MSHLYAHRSGPSHTAGQPASRRPHTDGRDTRHDCHMLLRPAGDGQGDWCGGTLPRLEVNPSITSSVYGFGTSTAKASAELPELVLRMDRSEFAASVAGEELSVQRNSPDSREAETDAN